MHQTMRLLSIMPWFADISAYQLNTSVSNRAINSPKVLSPQQEVWDRIIPGVQQYCQDPGYFPPNFPLCHSHCLPAVSPPHVPKLIPMFPGILWEKKKGQCLTAKGMLCYKHPS